MRHGRQVGLEFTKVSRDRRRAWQRTRRSGSRGCQRGADGIDRLGRCIVLLPDVLPRDVREIFLVAISLRLEYQAALVALRRLPEVAGVEKHAQLEGHVEAGQCVDRVVLDPQNVMNAELALVDQAVDPIDPRGTRLFGLKSAANGVAAVNDREDDRVDSGA